MKTEKKVVLGILLSLFLWFVGYIVYEHVSWVKSVDGKEFHGTIIQLSSEMSHGKYPRTHEYASILWDDGTTSYFELPPVHSYKVGDSWVTKVDQGLFDMSRYNWGEIPYSKDESNTIAVWYMFITALFVSIFGTFSIVGVGYLIYWCFQKEKDEE